ncbi:MAG: diacylglycerol kinase [Bacteroidetes bacterium RIFCSPLOWO2_12_FULL_31_6]|nr:MAG: diacylglycerol kinase [Bacteroidetes bacterium RIFCSPLOWO2_12_FULL_31_6]
MALKKMITSLIVAVAENQVIGKDNDLIWHLPNDMNYFKATTFGHHVITGRKNYISIDKKYRPLVNRTNIVLTKQLCYDEEGCVVLNSLEDAIAYAKNNNETEVFIIGGGQIYQEALAKKLIDKMYITHVKQSFEGDTFFPKITNSEWKKIKETTYSADDKHLYSYSFAVYEKI